MRICYSMSTYFAIVIIFEASMNGQFYVFKFKNFTSIYMHFGVLEKSEEMNRKEKNGAMKIEKHYFRRFEEARSACTLVITKLLFHVYMVFLSLTCALESVNIISVEYINRYFSKDLCRVSKNLFFFYI